MVSLQLPSISYAHAFWPFVDFLLGGLQELTQKLDSSQAQYAYVRIEYANDTESKRVKFVLIIWIGEGTKVMRKARVSIESGAVKKVLGHHSIQVEYGRSLVYLK